MSKLKTLKDLAFSHQLFSDKRVNLCREDNVREEAIKWVKELEKSPTEPFISVNKDIIQAKVEETSFKILIAENQALLNWIKHFFNITEEDLK